MQVYLFESFTITIDNRVEEPSESEVQQSLISEHPVSTATMSRKNPRRLAKDKQKRDADFAYSSIVDALPLNATSLHIRIISDNAIRKKYLQEAWRVRKGAWSNEEVEGPYVLSFK